MTAWPTRQAVVDLAREAAAIVRERFERAAIVHGRGHLVTEADLASEAHILDTIRERHPDHDILAEESSPVLSPLPDQARPLWVVDPLDGTRNFAAGLPHFAVSIGFGLRDASGYRPLRGAIVHPLSGNVWSAAEGDGAFHGDARIDPTKARRTSGNGALALDIGHVGGLRGALRLARVAIGPVRRTRVTRMPGSAALELAMTAAGEFAAFYGHGLSPWDVAAGVLLVTEAGGVVRSSRGNAFDVLSGGPFFAGGATAVAEMTR